MVTDAGTTAQELLLASTTFMPLDGAELPMVTVPVACVPPLSVDGFTAMLNSSGALICKVEEADFDPNAPLIVAIVSVDTADVVTVNEAVFDPLETVTDDGTTAFLFVDVRATTFPPVPAFPVSVTVPVVLVPPSTEAGDTLTLLSV